jgi:hypothetical protein
MLAGKEVVVVGESAVYEEKARSMLSILLQAVLAASQSRWLCRDDITKVE